MSLDYTVSIVSHLSGPWLAPLLADLRRTLPASAEVVLTINTPEDEGFLNVAADLPLKIVRNPRPKGFGENHNSAFAQSRGRVFVVVNPDIRLATSPFAALRAALSAGTIGASAPVVTGNDGKQEDSVRRFPTVPRLMTRVLLGRRRPDYVPSGDATIDIDWAAGMFVAFDRAAFARVQGFDTRYFMYFEDADICSRLQQAGLRVVLVPTATVIHHAQRSSHASLRHLRWHLRSAARFLLKV